MAISTVAWSQERASRPMHAVPVLEKESIQIESTQSPKPYERVLDPSLFIWKEKVQLPESIISTFMQETFSFLTSMQQAHVHWTIGEQELSKKETWQPVAREAYGGFLKAQSEAAIAHKVENALPWINTILRSDISLDLGSIFNDREDTAISHHQAIRYGLVINSIEADANAPLITAVSGSEDLYRNFAGQAQVSWTIGRIKHEHPRNNFSQPLHTAPAEKTILPIPTGRFALRSTPKENIFKNRESDPLKLFNLELNQAERYYRLRFTDPSTYDHTLRLPLRTGHEVERVFDQTGKPTHASIIGPLRGSRYLGRYALTYDQNAATMQWHLTLFPAAGSSLDLKIARPEKEHSLEAHTVTLEAAKIF